MTDGHLVAFSFLQNVTQGLHCDFLPFLNTRYAFKPPREEDRDGKFTELDPATRTMRLIGGPAAPMENEPRPIQACAFLLCRYRLISALVELS